MKSKGKKKEVVNKEENSENWCFVCKDGGEIRICDHKQCIKSYHPGCVEKSDSFLTSTKKWTCGDLALFFLCDRSSYLRCYTCPKALCRHCPLSRNFLPVKGQNGFCTCCLKLALLIEEDRNCDSDGEKIDFTDRETCEGLFMEYYMIIKGEEGFESEDIYAAKKRSEMKKNNQYGSGFEEYEEYHEEEDEEDDDDEEDEDEVSDYDDEDKKRKRNHKGKKSDRKKSAIQTPLRSNKKEFIGWGSRSLIEFLHSIGKSTNEKLSQHDVTSIVNNYVKENNLFYQGKKKMIECDPRLRSLFGKKIFSKNRVHSLLEGHFAENLEESDDEEEFGYDSEGDNKESFGACKERQRRTDCSEEKSQHKELESHVDQNCLAAIVCENIKLVYLRRSLLKELLKKHDNFEEKVIGCFVRVKSDPYDISRNSHQLMQVKGVKTISIGEINSETVLLFSAMPKEIKMSLLSDLDFSKEECEELRQKMLTGLLERPTVGDLQQKANMLHEDLTKHWISEQLVLLPKLMDRANEKGWRREFFEYSEKQKKLRTAEEEARLLKDIPKVTPDLSLLDPNPGDVINDMKIDEGSSNSILQCNASAPTDDAWQDEMTSASHPEIKSHIPDKSTVKLKHDTVISEEKTDQSDAVAQGSILWSGEMVELLDDDENGSDIKASSFEDGKVEEVEDEMWCIKGPCGEESKCSLLVMKKWSETSRYAAKFKARKENESEENAVWLKDAVNYAFPKT